MSDLSDSGRRGQQSDSFSPDVIAFPGAFPAMPDIIPFDVRGEFEDGGDFDPEPDPAAPALPAALTIRAPRGPQPETPGLTVYAVRFEGVDDDGEDDVAAAQPLSGKLASECHARVICAAHAIDRSRIAIPATHVVVNDHTGREVHRIPLLDAA